MNTHTFKTKSHSCDNFHFEQEGNKWLIFIHLYILLLFISDAKNSDICLALYRKSLKSTVSHSDGSHFDQEDPHVFVILGASVSFTIFFRTPLNFTDMFYY